MVLRLARLLRTYHFEAGNAVFAKSNLILGFMKRDVTNKKVCVHVTIKTHAVMWMVRVVRQSLSMRDRRTRQFTVSADRHADLGTAVMYVNLCQGNDKVTTLSDLARWETNVDRYELRQAQE